ncbi:MAG: hypothetical protein OQL28_04125, partial [Sedimenticola sp.]|nr:hypothetical protein [Sedimenticola sp.]
LEKLSTAVSELEEKGLNLFSTLRVGSLPESAAALLNQLELPPGDENRVILIGHGGRRLWQSLQQAHWHHADPIDNFSHAAANRFCQQLLQGYRHQVIYPGTCPVPLQQLGIRAGWHSDSPLGLGIHPEWGLWFAYRAAILTDAPLPEIRQPNPAAPCDQCLDQPCISHCPARALSATRQIDMSRCGDYRLQEDSTCSDRCLARLSCPVAGEHRYTLEQITYHYRLSLETLRHYHYGGK